MRITGNKPLSGIRGKDAKKKTSSGGSVFIPDSGEETPQSEALSGGVGVHSMDALLALQEIHDEPDRRSKAARRGHALLDGLESIRTDLLAGQISEERLEALAHEVAREGKSGDPKVDGVIDEIELRVKVELAKLGRFSD